MQRCCPPSPLRSKTSEAEKPDRAESRHRRQNQLRPCQCRHFRSGSDRGIARSGVGSPDRPRSVRRLESLLREGHVHARNGRASLYEPRQLSQSGALLQGCEYICELQPERRLAWEARWHENWPYAARRDQFIEPMANGHCRYWSTDAFLGENGVHVMRFCGPWVKRAFDDTAHALKARAEALHAERIGR